MHYSLKLNYYGSVFKFSGYSSDYILLFNRLKLIKIYGWIICTTFLKVVIRYGFMFCR